MGPRWVLVYVGTFKGIDEIHIAVNRVRTASVVVRADSMATFLKVDTTTTAGFAMSQESRSP
jgi:hypothetical protein